MTFVGSTRRRALREVLSDMMPRPVRWEEDPSMMRRRLADLTDVEFLIPPSDSNLTASQQAAQTFNRMTNEVSRKSWCERARSWCALRECLGFHRNEEPGLGDAGVTRLSNRCFSPDVKLCGC